ncbi:MAG: Asp-tRNA(Asn)/Glu-tRNA(Gln) amidotransferase GatCAB subunit B [Gammaproteobacteria bacterium CG_4_10_14_0_8_um_filter_38_16]|nr:MAG: Asp-tRNA(Asn)/Glu-tRNA(Gln) amidotransferase GatCAB subunit B [Gammaproteobacteria bacterium CG_4_10_14_0_8_um_filter_38_16]PJA03342.1 MAG: Asp-tRNA(Asn)/Glu-tRNA(Gln) amidotransferase GatCAB subunit B [Gammaproteobacteria bacterium CG_4_10_14_0_2_um_filter_38_22]
MTWETVIGLEVHVQLATKTKIFSGASTAFGAEPNTQACAVDLGLPGVLPVLNEETVKLAVTFGLSVGAQITKCSVFARKNYFYPDLPKGYQISQHNLPIVGEGKLDITLDDGATKTIRITRAHLEEDAGKSLHEGLPNVSGVDLNRAGTPLLEIVSEPDMRSSSEAVAYLKKLHQLVRYLGISDGNMQEGSFRCDVNISLRKMGADTFGTRAEIKNVNSFKFVEQAIEYEIDRQKEILENGGTIIQETRQYDPDENITRSLRSKENAPDYRYFPDPDLLPVVVSDAYLASILETLPELPWHKRDRLKQDYDLNDYDAEFISGQLAIAHYFEAALKNANGAKPKLIANWIAGELSAFLNKHNLSIEQSPINAKQLGELVARIHDNTISNNIAKQVFEALWNKAGSVDEIIEEKGLKQITDTGAIEKMIDTIIANNPNQVADYRAGKEKLFGFFVGLVMKETKGKANPAQLNALLKQKLQS